MRVYHKEDGEILFTMSAETFEGFSHITDAFIDVEDQDIDTSIYRVENGELVYTPLPITNEDVNAERDRRLNKTFFFEGVEYNCDQQSLARITGSATLAGFAVAAGAQAGNYLWHGGSTDFMWIDANNSLNLMDAQTCFAFGQAAATNQSAHIFAADILKRQIPIPTDYKNDIHWPQPTAVTTE